MWLNQTSTLTRWNTNIRSSLESRRPSSLLTQWELSATILGKEDIEDYMIVSLRNEIHLKHNPEFSQEEIQTRRLTLDSSIWRDFNDPYNEDALFLL